MIKKMIENDLLAEINYDNVPNAKANIGQQYWDMSKEFDPETIFRSLLLGHRGYSL